MPLPLPKLVLLPGMDGTGELFSDFVEALPSSFETEVVSYPTDRCLSYAELAPLVWTAIQATEPFVLVAESFSSPLAIQCAAKNPPNLKGLVICAGFAASPIRGWLRRTCLLLSPILCIRTLPEFAVRLLLLGSGANPSLMAKVRAVISSVARKVLSARFRAVLACDARADLARVGVPILYLQAQDDRLVKESCAEEILRIKPLATMERIAGPHLLLQREPQRSAQIVVEFVHQLAQANR